MKEIKLCKRNLKNKKYDGFVALVDDEDFELLNKWTWSIDKRDNRFYARSTMPLFNNKRCYMHRFVLDAKVGEIIDHKDSNGLNNQKNNLRICTQAQNAKNQNKRKGSSRFKGVWFSKHRSKWLAYITVNYKKINLGGFYSEVEAAKAYNEAATKHFGEFSKLNDI